MRAAADQMLPVPPGSKLCPEFYKIISIVTKNTCILMFLII